MHIRIRITWSEVAQSCLTVCDPMDCSLPGSSVHGIFQSRVLEWIAISFSRGSSRPRNQTRVSCIAGRRFTIWATREAQRKKGENTEPNTYGFRLENALLNTHTSEEDPAITVHYEQKSRGYERIWARSNESSTALRFLFRIRSRIPSGPTS